MSDFRFGTAFVMPDHRSFVEAAKRSEDDGFDLVSTGDSQCLFLDVYSMLTLAAEHTSEVMVGPMVTNPVTRHPAVTAGAISTVQSIADGRAFLTLSSGDSSLLNIGERPAPLRQVAEYGQIVRALTNGETVEHHGAEFKMHWETRRVPLYLTPEGPKGLEQAGRIADGIFLNNGISPDVVRDSLRRISDGAKSVGRELKDIDIWLAIRGFKVGEDHASAVDKIRFQLAGTLNHVFRFTLEGKLVPEAHVEGLNALQREYRSDIHFSPERGKQNAALLDKYGLLNWAVERFAIAGPSSYCVDRLSSLAEATGISKFFIPHIGTNVDEFADAMGKEVIPALK
jgi:5,10-methylenetetrahydromethanopterin reductase